MPAGFATFLANIGQLPDGSESPGFDQLLAAAPVAVAPATNAAATIKTGSAPAAEAAAPQIDMPPLEDAVSVEASVVKTEPAKAPVDRSEEHTSELQSLMRISYAVLCLKKKKI